ncbi:von Willebrand factor-like [Palaemon carinicauda]|uniref:von Willebrand factor-like n=1 Tax=Palaemon carinicauda TaxID=392227 RepID=UPI0035B572FF
MTGRLLIFFLNHILISQGRHAREAAGDKCIVQMDKNLTTFDGWFYQHNAKCESVLVQKATSHDPQFGVFKEYSKCEEERACFGPSTFQNNPGDDIKIGTLGNQVPELYKLQVNEKPYEIMDEIPRPIKEGGRDLPVLAWRHRGCIRMLGSSNLALQICATSLSIWTSSKTQESLFGLCGSYDGQTDNDFTKRDRSVSPLKTHLPDVGFIDSWAVEPSCVEEAAHVVRKRNTITLVIIKSESYFSIPLNIIRIFIILHNKCKLMFFFLLL